MNWRAMVQSGEIDWPRRKDPAALKGHACRKRDRERWPERQRQARTTRDRLSASLGLSVWEVPNELVDVEIALKLSKESCRDRH